MLLSPMASWEALATICASAYKSSAVLSPGWTRRTSRVPSVMPDPGHLDGLGVKVPTSPLYVLCVLYVR